MLKELKYEIKVFPFWIAGIYLLYMLLCFLGLPEYIMVWLDSMVYASPLYSYQCIRLSLKAGFCNWHRTAILIPLLSALFANLNNLLPDEVVYTNFILLIFLTALTIFSGIKVLWRKR